MICPEQPEPDRPIACHPGWSALFPTRSRRAKAEQPVGDNAFHLLTSRLATVASAVPVFALAAVILLVPSTARAAVTTAAELDAAFRSPPDAAKPWVFWYWMSAAVTKAGITADLEAMHQAGIGGVYLVPIKGAANPPLIEPVVQQMTPAWWEHLRHAFTECDRLGLKIAMHASDGFATAGGPWITPETSMQRVVWSETVVEGGRPIAQILPRPAAKLDYYRELSVVAYPLGKDGDASSRTLAPRITTSVTGIDAQFLAGDGDRVFTSREACWVQYEFAEPFTCRSLTVRLPRTTGIQQATYNANRFTLEVSDDGAAFRKVADFTPPRHGWQDGDADVTHAVPPVTARFFRFVFDPAKTEPGAEDFDSAKWKNAVKLTGIDLSAEARLHQFEGKSGVVWRVAPETTPEQVPADAAVPFASFVTLTDRVAADGRLEWDAPPGRWRILRIGYTTTGHTNYTGGGALGLECDKFSADVARLQFDRWIGETIRQVGPELAARVLKACHVDSWECGSQNWSPVFRDEFQRRRGYDPLPFLPAMAGVPVQSVADSERFLRDVRATIAELVVDNFYRPLTALAHEHGMSFTGEAVAPTMLSDGLAHHGAIDVPMGEFWLRSPTHDKLNDMLDAISGAHVYGKNLVQAEAFTEVRLQWDEHPAMLKTLGDRNYALGVNRFVYHVFTHNPWLDRRPGMTLGGVGLFFQRDQTWWKPGRAWVEYAQRCQALLQLGRPVVDVAVFTGEDLPRRAVLPWNLATTLPGLLGGDGERWNRKIFENADWVDPLRGYAYDSINPDALLRLARVRDGAIELPGGARYRLLVLPAAMPSAPGAARLSPVVRAKVDELVAAGATVLSAEEKLAASGTGRVVGGPWAEASFDRLELTRDFAVFEGASQAAAADFAWAHRAGEDWDLYFVSNQREEPRDVTLSFRMSGRVPELWNPVSGEQQTARTWRVADGRTEIPLRLPPAGSLFVVFRQPAAAGQRADGDNRPSPTVVRTLSGAWSVRFDPARGGPSAPVTFPALASWTEHAEPGVRHYSGTAVYTQTLEVRAPKGGERVWLDVGRVADIAEVRINGVTCGIAWTPPYRVEITQALRDGRNEVEIEVTNTWFNRLAYDRTLPEEQRLTRTTAPERTEGRPPLPAGLLGPVTLLKH